MSCVSRGLGPSYSVSRRAAASQVSHSSPRHNHRSTHLWRELAREVLELLELLANVDLALLVQQHRDQRLSAACILDCLGCEEELVGGVVVVFAVVGSVGRLLARRVLEEKDDAVDVAERSQRVGVECGELFELDVLNPKLLDEVREDTLGLVSFRRASCWTAPHTASDSIVFQPPDMLVAFCSWLLRLRRLTTLPHRCDALEERPAYIITSETEFRFGSGDSIHVIMTSSTSDDLTKHYLFLLSTRHSSGST